MLTGWNQPVTLLPIGPNAVQLWRLNLLAGDGGPEMNRLTSVLSESEKHRASGMRVESVRAEFVAARWLLRHLLSRTMDVDPRLIVLAAGKNGKPCLATPAGLEFNLSHSRGLILLGISTAGPIGVDVEFIDSAFAGSPEMLTIAQETLPRSDVLAIEGAVRGRERDLAFYRAWTRHEAVGKADGRGIAEPFDARTSRQLSSRFIINEVDAGVEHCAALATTTGQGDTALLDATALSLRESAVDYPYTAQPE